MDLLHELERLRRELIVSIKNLRKAGSAYANAERDYKIALRKEALRLRSEEMPVTLIDKVVYGDKAVADARFARDISEATYKANQEHINGVKLQMRLIESQISREWTTDGAS